MTFKLRDYQQDAVDKTIAFISKCYDSCLLELATGAGKSLIVSEIARFLKDNSGKKVLCLAPSKELVEQNRAAYLAYGEPASMFSASAGSKCMKHNVIFGSPLSVLNSIDSFKSDFAAVIIDEAHGITPTVKNVIAALRERNPKIRIIGLTATPYRTGSGYIYAYDENNKAIEENETKDPYFFRLLCRVTAKQLIDRGYLTPPLADIKEGYDTSNLELSSTGKFSANSVEQAFEGKGRKTAAITAQVVDLCANRKGVMFFAATIQHANEVMDSLPKENSEIITGATKKKDREEIIKRFKSRQFKYLVNVSVLTTGFDAPHVDCIAILRATESPALLQQIIGRGLRLCDDKHDCLVLDYAENIERHDLEDDLFSPKISVTITGQEKFRLDASCDLCGTVNEFSGRPNPESFKVNDSGYFVDLAGEVVMLEDQPMPAHFGRRCQAQTVIKGKHEQCPHRWSFKICEECDHENDIAARYCVKCKTELIDPNKKLVIDFKRMKSSPRMMSSDKLVSWFAQAWTSQKGNKSLRVDWTTEYRSFSAWYSPDSRTASGQSLWANLSESVFNGRIAPTIDAFIKALQKGQGTMPTTITSKKEGDFFKVTAHNQDEDVLNEN